MDASFSVYRQEAPQRSAGRNWAGAERVSKEEAEDGPMEATLPCHQMTGSGTAAKLHCHAGVTPDCQKGFCQRCGSWQKPQEGLNRAPHLWNPQSLHVVFESSHLQELTSAINGLALYRQCTLGPEGGVRCSRNEDWVDPPLEHRLCQAMLLGGDCDALQYLQERWHMGSGG